jgi:transposase-like protein
MGAPSELSAAERMEIVLALIRREEPAEVLARRHGVSANTLYAWRDTFLEGGKAALAPGKGKGDPQVRRNRELEKELFERDRVIGELTIANRILKKVRDGLL